MTTLIVVPVVAPWKLDFWLHLLYLALAFPIGLGYFVLLVVGLTTSASLIIIWIGVPMLAIMLVVIRALGRVEQVLLNELTRARLRDPAHPIVASGTIWDRVKTMTLDPHTYRTGLWLLLRFPLGLGAFIALVTSGAFAFVGIVDSGLGIETANVNVDAVIWNDLPSWLQTISGLLAVLAFYGLVEAFVFLHRLIGSYLLGTPASERIKAIEKQVQEAGASLDVAEQLHDGLGHTISVMTMQAGAARLSLSESDQEGPAATALRIVEEKGREALSELDRVLSVLDEPSGRVDQYQAAGLAGIEHLVDGIRHGGVEVNLTIDNSPPLTKPLEAMAYEVVRESLTNVLKHAGADARLVEVSVTSDNTRLAINVANGGDQIDDVTRGRGIMGMVKRVEVYGGHLDARPRPDGGFAVEATIPIP